MQIEQVIQENGTYIYNYAMRLTCHPQAAEDLAQQTFITAWEKADQLKEEYALKKWLRTICYHQFLMDCRKQDMKLDFYGELSELEQEGKVMAAAEAAPEEAVLVEESIQSLQNGCFYAMARKLTLPQRIAFSMVDMFGLSMEETAEMLEISVGALKGLLFRARMNLDAFFSNHCNLIDATNPCSCEAWIHFSETQSSNQKMIRQVIEKKEYKEKGYHFDEQIRRKITYLYKNIPEKRPSDVWFQKVIDAVS